MKRRFQTRARRNGVTLVELLVVASIMLTLAAVSVPAIKPMMESQLTSNAATTVSTYLNRARARAMLTGRPCGVLFEYFQGTYVEDADIGSASMVLRQVEVPPYYAGLEDNATVSVKPEDDLVERGKRVRKITEIQDDYFGAFLETDEDLEEWDKIASIQFNNCGPFYSVLWSSSGYYIEKLPGVELPMRLNVPFKIARAPRPTMTSPIGLPQGAVVDLEFSGEENSCFYPNGDVTVMFSPSGDVDYVQDSAGRFIPTDTIYFLIGRWDRITALNTTGDPDTPYVDDPDYGYISLTEDGLWNFEDGTNYWVTINPRTGLVSTVELNPPVNYTVNNWDEAINESREFGRMSKRNLGGH